MAGSGTWEGAPQQSLVHFAVVHWHRSLTEALERGLQRVRQYMREKATLLLGAGLKTKASGGFRDKSFSLKIGKSRAPTQGSAQPVVAATFQAPCLLKNYCGSFSSAIPSNHQPMKLEKLWSHFIGGKTEAPRLCNFFTVI